MNRTRGFVNLNRFKSGRAIRKLKSIIGKADRIEAEAKKRRRKGR